MPLQRNICTLILVARSSQSQSQSQSSHFSFPCKSEPPATSAARFVRFAHGLPKTRRSPPRSVSTTPPSPREPRSDRMNPQPGDLHLGLYSSQPPPQTHTRPLPPLPTRLRHQVNSRPASPDGPGQPRRDSSDYHIGHASSSTASTPNAPSPLNPSPSDDFAAGVAAGLKRDSRGRPAERSFPGSRVPSPHVPLVADAYGQAFAAAESTGEEKPAKKVRVGARASIACTTCR